MEINIQLDCEKVEITPSSYNKITVELIDVDKSDILDKFTIDDIIYHFTIKDILNNIDIEVVKTHFDLIENEE